MAAGVIGSLSGWAFFSVLLDVAIPSIYAEGHFGRGVAILLLAVLILLLQQSNFIRVCFGDPGKVSPDTYMVSCFLGWFPFESKSFLCVA